MWQLEEMKYFCESAKRALNPSCQHLRPFDIIRNNRISAVDTFPMEKEKDRKLSDRDEASNDIGVSVNSVNV